MRRSELARPASKLVSTGYSSVLIGLLTVAVLATACGHRASSGGTSNAGDGVVAVTMQPEPVIAPPFQGAVAFAKPVAMSHQGSAAESRQASKQDDKPAADFQTEWENNRVTPNGSVAVFAPAWNGASDGQDHLAYCCYRYQLGDSAAAGHQTLGLSWDAEHAPADVTTQCCLGLSNWAADKWDWFAAPADGVLTIPSYAPYTSSAGEALVMLVVMGTASISLERATVGSPELRGTGLLQGEASAATSQATVFHTTSDTFPASIDISGDMPPIRDQGLAGSCTAFSVGDSAFGYELNQLYKNSGWNKSDNFNRVAPRYLYVETGFAPLPAPPPIFYAPLPEPTCRDTGRYIDLVFAFLQSNGVPVESHAPYSDNQCDRNWSADALTDVPLLKITGFSAIPGEAATTVDDIKDVLVNQHRPVVMGFQVDQAYVDYQPGQVWSFIGPSLGGHAVAIVGYDDSLQAFKIRNSWSTFWGDQGHAFIAYSAFSGPTGAQVQTCFFLNGTFNAAVASRFCPGGGLPAAPTGVAATDGTLSDRVRVTWSAVTGATSYKVFRSATASGTFTQIGTATATQFDALMATAPPQFYKVKAVNPSGDSALSTADSGFPGVAAPVVAASDGTFLDKIRLSWGAVSGATGYKIFRATTLTGTYSLIQTISSGATVQFDDPTTSSAARFYRMKTVKSGSESALSVPDSGVILGVPVITATDGTLSDRTSITWPAVPGATTYKVFHAATATSTFNQIGNPTAALRFDFLLSGVAPSFFKVKASNANGDSGFSNTDSGFAGVVTPHNIVAGDGTFPNKVRVSWSTVSGATGYKVFRSAAQAGPYTQIGAVTGAGTLLFDDTAVGTGTFFYRVKTVATAGDSCLSAIDSGFKQ